MSKRDNTRELLGEFLPDALAIEFRDPPAGHKLTLYALLALLATALIWASVSKMDKLVIGTGRLVTPLSNLVVQPLEPGILKTINVRVGQVVKKGAVLATLDPTFATADASQLGSREETLSIQARRIESELKGQVGKTLPADNPQARLQASLLTERQGAYAGKIRQFDETIHRLQASLNTNKQDQATLASRVKTLQELEKMFLELETNKFGSRVRRLEAEEKRLEVERDLHLALNREREIHREIAGTEAERMTFSKTWRQEAMEKLSATMQQRDEVSNQLDKARLRSRLVDLTAPEDAIVLEIGKKSVGSVLKDAEALFTLVPLNAQLEVESEVTPADVAEIRVGDTVRIKLDAYPFQKHGTATAKVSSISADTFSRQTSSGGQSFHYLVRASLERTQLQQTPSPTRLLPGMTVTAEIVTGNRTVLSYFLYPVIRILDESFRER